VVKQNATLEAKAKPHGETHEKVDQLYDSISKGLTPGFPDEDALEKQFYIAQGGHDKVKAGIVQTIQTERYLIQASSQLSRAHDLAKSARFEAENSIFSFSGAYGLLGLSGYLITRTTLLIDKAVEAVEALESLDPPMEDAKGDLEALLQGARVQRESRFGNEDLVNRVVEAQERLAEANLRLAELACLVKARESAGREAIKKTAWKLEDARQALQQRREAAFDETVGLGTAVPAYGEAPAEGKVPTYRECCDRADAFCSGG
jgi:hypothetical protein